MKNISDELFALRGHFAYLFRSHTEEEISFYLKTNFSAENSKDLSEINVENLWDVGLYIVEEVSKHNIKKAKNLLNMFSDYQNTFSTQIKNAFEGISQNVNTLIEEDGQLEIVGITETSTATSSSLE